MECALMGELRGGVYPYLTECESARIPVDAKQIEEKTTALLPAQPHQLTQFEQQSVLEFRLGMKHREHGYKRTTGTDIGFESKRNVGQGGRLNVYDRYEFSRYRSCAAGLLV